MSKADIRALILKVISKEELEDAITEQIQDFIDYEDLAVEIVSTYEDEIPELVMDVAMELLEDGCPF